MKRYSTLAILLLVFCVITLGSWFAWQLNTPAAPSSSFDSDKAIPTESPYVEVSYRFGRGFIGENWQVYFTEPEAGADRADYADGIDSALAGAIDATLHTLDIAAFELNSKSIYEAILDAHRRGVAVRIVTDDEHGLDDRSNAELRDLGAAGIPIVTDNRSGLMHNKFMILDGSAVWTGSWNYTLNGTYRNNNNVLVLENALAAAAYETEFIEMFERNEFGARSTDAGITVSGDDASEIRIIFAPEADEIAALLAEIGAAQTSIHFMTFVFSLDGLADVMIKKMEEPNFVLRGVFETRNSTASWSQLPALYCAGAHVRQDGNRYILHHKVIIIDDDTVIAGSFNFSNSAAKENDENIVIIRDAVITSLYLDEWRRIWDSAQEVSPGEVNCD